VRRLAYLRAVVIVALVGTAATATAQALGAFGDASGPPAPTITDAPIRPTIATSATFGFTGLAASFECSMDGAAFRLCTSPVTYTGLARTAHTFRVRGRDGSGNTGDVASYTWQIVLPTNKPPAGVVPRPVMTTVPVKPWISRTATFAWDGRGAPASQCSLDGSTWRACAAPRTYRGLALGKHAFGVRGVDGSRHSTVNSFTWTITPGLPPAPPVLTGGPDADTTSTDAVFSFDVPPGLDFECMIDASGWHQCSNPAIYVGLGTGRHTFCVRSVRQNGVPGLPSCTTWFIHSPVQPAAAPSPTPVPPVPPAGTFTISGNVPGLLSPGIGAPVPVTITNPLTFPLTVTDLVMTPTAGSSNAGCDGPTNLSVAQSNMAGGSVPVVVPAGGSVLLPAQGATEPVVTMLDLASNQDACKGATFSFTYSAMGTG
jgi:large repetitive protein